MSPKRAAEEININIELDGAHHNTSYQQQKDRQRDEALRQTNWIIIRISNQELLGKTTQDITGIRPGEKLHEVLINSDEIRYAWNVNDMYMLANPHHELFHVNNLSEIYDGIKKVTDISSYSSDSAERITKEELKEKILELKLIMDGKDVRSYRYKGKTSPDLVIRDRRFI